MHTYPQPAGHTVCRMEQTTTQQRGISLTRLAIALLTVGISVPFIGIRRTRKTKTIYKE